MKKIVALVISLFVLLGSSSLVYANGQGNLHFSPYSASYEGNDLIIKAVLANTGNKKLEGVSSFSLEVFDAEGSKIANVSFYKDNFLTSLSLEPGDSVYWSMRISGAEKGNLASYKTKYSADFKSVGDASHTSGTLIVVNNKTLKTDVTPFVENGTTLVPLRAIFESLGATVKWDSKTQTVTATRNGDVVKLTIGNKHLTINGKKVTFDASTKIVDGSTMVPLRAISESFGGTVAYGKTAEAVTISIRLD